METKKITTKKGYTAVIINNSITVSLKDGQYLIYNNVASGVTCEDQSSVELFVIAYEKSIVDKKQALIAAKEEAERLEQKRLDDISNKIEMCDSPVDLATMFDFKMVERASHWSDLYEGRSRYACHISSRVDYEIMKMAIDKHDIAGEWVELKNRAGEHHSTGSSVYNLDTYQEGLRRHFNGDGFFYKSQETEKEYLMECVAEAAQNENIEKVRELLTAYDEIEPGYYDCNGNLEILESDLESNEITGYSYDVYTYNFGFEFEFKYSFNQVEEMEEND